MSHHSRCAAPLVLLSIVLPAITCLAQENVPMTTAVDRPACPEHATLYTANRAPLTPSPLMKLPIGAIRPEGWLRHQLELMAGGMTGRLTEVSKWCQFDGNAWASPTGEGENGWEELPYWLKGFGDLGYVLGDERITAEAHKWIDAVLASQREDGYFGPEPNRKHNDIWPNMIMLDVLRTFHEATGDPRVLPFMTRYFQWQLAQGEALLPGSWQKIRGGDNLHSIYWLYNRTGDAFLLDLAELIHKRTANWKDEIVSWHGVNICQGFREPAVYYQQSHNDADLAAAERNYQEVMDLFGQVPGGMFGADENARPGYAGPRQGAETCSMVEFMLSFELLLGITGDITFADRCEEVAFNSLPAALTPDLKGLHYLTGANMVQLDETSKAPLLQNGGCMLGYSPGPRYRCCQHNVSHGWPYFAEHLWMATGDNGLAAVLYAANEVKVKVGEKGQEITFIEQTDYPFEDTIRIELRTEAPIQFPLYLRVPAWAGQAQVSVNGKAVDTAARPGAYLRIDRTWNNGDQVALVLPMTIRLRTWEKNNNSVSVDRGPLTYSLKIGERWAQFGDINGWPELDVFPTTPWNYGLVIDPDNPAASFEVRTPSGPLPLQPFDVKTAPIQLTAQARKIPEWTLTREGLVGKLQDSPAYSDAPIEQVTLIPMGCARLRIAAFPTVSADTNANRWQEPIEPYATSYYSDELSALGDGVEPKNSNDHDIPRFTWWDHKGTAEWIEWNLGKPQTVQGIEIYWFDDEPIGGHCRTPRSWSLLYREKDAWKPVPNPANAGTAKDQYNRLTFDPIKTEALRLEVQLQPNWSGGILEWRIAKP